MAAGALRCWCQVTPHTYHGSGSEVLVQGYRGEGMPTSPAICEEGAARCCGLLAWLLSPWSTPASGGNASGLQRQDSPASALGQEMERAAEEVLARNIQFHQEGGREAQLDRIQIIETHHMAVERRQREFGHEVQTIGNPEGLGHHLVIGAHEQGIPGAGAGVRIDDWMLEGRIGGDVEGQQRGQSPAEAVPTDREGADRRLGSLVISGVHNYLIFQANKAYPDRSRWIRWNKCLTFTIPYQRRLMTLILLLNPSTNPLVCLSRK